MGNWQERFYMGTWQLGGDFGAISDSKCKALINHALKVGITHFDTAAVYGKGRSESLLGEILPQNAKILTKVPAIRKPGLEEDGDINDFYPSDQVKRNVEESLARLRRDHVQTVILHNWSRKWETLGEGVSEYFTVLRQKGVVNQIGVSLPDNYRQRLPLSVLQQIQVIEAPLNLFNQWLKDDLEFYKSFGIEVIIRSIFLQGALLLTKDQREKLPITDPRRSRYTEIGLPHLKPEKILAEVWKENTSLVVGMMEIKEVNDNVSLISQL